MTVSVAASDPAVPEALRSAWRAAWPKALAAWSRFTRLRDPQLCPTREMAADNGLSGSFAMIRFDDQTIVIDLETVRKLDLQDYAVEILAHEIGHHILAPASVSEHFRLLARMRRALPTIEHNAPLVANLYTDLLINDRLQRQAELRMADIYERLEAAQDTGGSASWAWSLYLRICEHLWGLEKGRLACRPLPPGHRADFLDGDAWLGARLIRVYADDWLRGAGSFATLLLPYLLEDGSEGTAPGWLLDTRNAAAGSEPQGGVKIDADEGDARHPSEDPLVSGLDDDAVEPAGVDAVVDNAPGQAREPWEYGAILKAAGINLTDHDIAVRYYRQRAVPYLVPFPSRSHPSSPEPLVEGLEPWGIGDPLDELDWFQSVMLSPLPIPGQSTVKRVYGRDEGRARQRLPVDLDLYVDSSGSMPNPQVRISYLALAGAVIALSALRAGSRVQATLWSGQRQVARTMGFVRDEDAILRVLTGFFGGGTAFPIHRLRETYGRPQPDGHLERPVHILHLSDDGITTMFATDELGNSGWDVCARSLAVAGGGGTMALHLPASWCQHAPAHKVYRDILRAETEQGWAVHAVVDLPGLLDFARAFAHRHYADRPELKQP